MVSYKALNTSLKNDAKIRSVYVGVVFIFN